MNSTIRNSIIALLVLGAAGFGAYRWMQSQKPAEKNEAPIARAQPPAASASPKEAMAPQGAGGRYPVPRAGHQAIPQSIEEGDLVFNETFSELIGKAAFDSLFDADDLIRRFVVMIENFKGEWNLDLLPYRTPEKKFQVKREGGKIFADVSKNRARYRPFLELFEKADEKKVADLYFNFYPLFQAAYHEINPQGHFNDRMIEMIDHLSSSPDLKSPPELLQMNQSYKYADAKLESLSSAKKWWIRLAPEHPETIREKLKKFREILILGQ